MPKHQKPSPWRDAGSRNVRFPVRSSRRTSVLTKNR
jgi:hypothetical protein